MAASCDPNTASQKNINGKIIPPNRKFVHSNDAIKEGLVQVGAGN